MNQLFVLALAAVIVALVNAQSPPSASNVCVTATLPASSFCGTNVTYTISNSTVIATADASASSNYNAALTTLGGSPSQACKSALATFYCQNSFLRCSTYYLSSGVANARCQAVNTACGITNFPSGGYQGSACIANAAVSVDGPETLCASSTTSTLGGSCSATAVSSATFPYTNGTLQSVVCPLVSSCNTTSSTCVRPNNLGDACSSTCTQSSIYSIGTTTLTCVAGTCQYLNKRQGYSCLSNGECLSGNCTAGTCSEQPVGGPCTLTSQCRTGLYCDSFNSTCYAASTAGLNCGQLQTNWSPVPCVSGYTCVRGTGNTTFSTCMANANIGQPCVPAAGTTVVYNSPLCAPNTVVSGTATCVNSVCTNVQSGTIGMTCNSTTPCITSLTCQYPAAGGVNAQGVCATPSNVQCGTAPGSPTCNSYQTCSCSTSSAGTCTPASSNPMVACAAQTTNLQNCLLTNCQSATSPYIFFDQYSCGSKNCNLQTLQYVCCAASAVGTSFVGPNGFNQTICSSIPTPTPAPGPTTTAGPTSTSGPTSAGPTATATPVPIQSSKKSGAASVSVSFVAMIVAIIAFCL